jgi:hypothetical protein
MDKTESLESKIDELISSLGGLERLRELSRLTSLDHLVNLHLLSHLTKLDKIEGLQQLDKLEVLSSLDQLQNLEKLSLLDQLKVIDEIQKLDQLENLEHLKEIEKLSSLESLSELSQLVQLENLKSLKNLNSLSKLDNLKELKRLDHLEYLSALDRLQELAVLNKLDQLVGLKELLEKNDSNFSKLRHLEALNNLPLLEKLSELDKLDKLDKLDELSNLKNNEDIPPAFPLSVSTTITPFKNHFISFGLDLLRTIVLAGVILFSLNFPKGREVSSNALSYLGFGQGVQVNWALETLWNSSPDDFATYWADFISRIDNDIKLVLNNESYLSQHKKFEILSQLWIYKFTYDGQQLNQVIRKKLSTQLEVYEREWMDKINIEIGQLMLRQGSSEKLSDWNQLKDLAVGGRWKELFVLSSENKNDSFAVEANTISMIHLQLNDPEELKTLVLKD